MVIRIVQRQLQLIIAKFSKSTNQLEDFLGLLDECVLCSEYVSSLVKSLLPGWGFQYAC